MFVLVLTGGLGAGKSTAARLFAERGATVLDLDDVAARLMEPGSDLVARIAERFGPDVLLADGAVDRPALARAAFVSRDATRDLNAIVHPDVAREVGEALKELRLMPHQPDVVVLEVPLLAEAPVFAELADEVLAIVAPESVRIERATQRGMSQSEATRRVRAQATDAERAEIAETVIVNTGTAEEFEASLNRFWEERVALDAPRDES